MDGYGNSYGEKVGITEGKGDLSEPPKLAKLCKHLVLI